MPKYGQTMQEGTVLRWLKQKGDAVSSGESVVEVETDKVTVEIQSEIAGFLREILVAPGETVPVLERLAWIGDIDEPLPGEV